MGTLSSIGNDFIHLVFSAVLMLLLLRLLLQLTRADFYNPISQAVVRTTAWLDPLRRVLGQHGGLDVATLLALFAVQMAEVATSSQLVGGHVPGLLPLFASSTVLLLDWLLTFFFWAILAMVVISWVAPQGDNPVASLLYSITEPLMAPARRLLPPIGGLDLSPMLVMFVIHVLRQYGMPALVDLMQPLFR